MARAKTKTPARTVATNPGLRARGRTGIRGLLRWVRRIAFWAAAAVFVWVLSYRWIDPPTTPYILSESRRLGGVERTWIDIGAIAPVVARSVVAAEDANFCRHWGFDVGAIRQAIAAGGQRGASTISQQVVKNAFLWQGRSWARKALETALTPLMEALWPKRRILEVYLNLAELDSGVFGVGAAAQGYFGTSAGALSARQAALLAAVLPDPRNRDAARPTELIDRRARSIAGGAETIAADGRAACFED